MSRKATRIKKAPIRGLDFEEAVFRFCKMLDPEAQVLFNQKVPDRDTQKPRQVDVWVNFRVMKHYPASMLISCKDHRRKLDIGAVDTLLSEMRATGAVFGVLYARGGFTSSALEKARANQISCCRLFDNAPPEQPQELIFDLYAACPQFEIVVQPSDPTQLHEIAWSSLSPKPAQVYDLFSACCIRLFAQSEAQRIAPGQDCRPIGLRESYDFSAKVCPPFRVHVILTWGWYKARFNAFRLKGSLNTSTNEFIGKTQSPAFPMTRPLDHNEWEVCQAPKQPVFGFRILLTCQGFPMPHDVHRALHSAQIFSGGPWRFRPVPGLSPHSIAEALHSGMFTLPDVGVQFTFDQLHKP